MVMTLRASFLSLLCSFCIIRFYARRLQPERKGIQANGHHDFRHSHPGGVTGVLFDSLSRVKTIQSLNALSMMLLRASGPRLCFSASVAAPRGAAPSLHIETPLVYSDTLSQYLGADVYLKMDCLQPPGSFKIRGIGETVRRAVDGGAGRIVSSSGGNAGIAAAYAAQALNVPCTVVLPTTTPQSVHKRLQSFGAEVVVHGNVWDEADEYARQVVEEQKGAYVHPFGQSSTWEGHATLVDELHQQLPTAPDAIVTCVGGGGLLMGILHGLEKHGWSSTRVVACETEGAASMAGSLDAGKLVTIPITSVAKSLGAQCVGKEIFEKCKELGPDRVRTFVMSDAAAVAACVRLCTDHRVLVEPACGAALSAITEKSDALEGCKTVVVEVCGGAIVDLTSLTSLAQELGVLEG